ncbi:MAG: hypothetical protein NTY66_02160 [Candidatus Vogelbacteria bacterium]|nr:hypothetical protein [Candidatus Vogelbacteria bacterium]
MHICKLCCKDFKDYQDRGRSRCGSCNTKIRRYRAKIAAVKSLGGKCVKCGWQGNQAAFQFHHTDPGKKDFTIGNVANKKWDFIKKELEKCVLLCSNCHAIIHSSKDDKEFIKEAEQYRGRKLEL